MKQNNKISTSRKFNPEIARIARIKIGESVVIMRKERGYTQEHLASMAQISKVRLIDVEKGRTDYQIDTLMAILGALQCHLDIFLRDPSAPAGFNPPEIN